eukprot:COSAG04_NODE_3846_length_2478_cov_1.182430_3_plen_172_part_00
MFCFASSVLLRLERAVFVWPWKTEERLLTCRGWWSFGGRERVAAGGGLPPPRRAHQVLSLRGRPAAAAVPAEPELDSDRRRPGSTRGEWRRTEHRIRLSQLQKKLTLLCAGHRRTTGRARWPSQAPVTRGPSRRRSPTSRHSPRSYSRCADTFMSTAIADTHGSRLCLFGS